VSARHSFTACLIASGLIDCSTARNAERSELHARDRSHRCRTITICSERRPEAAVQISTACADKQGLSEQDRKPAKKQRRVNMDQNMA
jgi:hypothetical protein